MLSNPWAVTSEAPLILKKRGLNLYCINGKIAVDKVCLFENMSDELTFLQQRLNLPEPIILPSAKSSFRKDKRPYYEILTTDEIEKVAELFQEEMRLFGYKKYQANIM